MGNKNRNWESVTQLTCDRNRQLNPWIRLEKITTVSSYFPKPSVLCWFAGLQCELHVTRKKEFTLPVWMLSITRQDFGMIPESRKILTEGISVLQQYPLSQICSWLIRLNLNLQTEEKAEDKMKCTACLIPGVSMRDLKSCFRLSDCWSLMPVNLTSVRTTGAEGFSLRSLGLMWSTWAPG